MINYRTKESFVVCYCGLPRSSYQHWVGPRDCEELQKLDGEILCARSFAEKESWQNMAFIDDTGEKCAGQLC